MTDTQANTEREQTPDPVRDYIHGSTSGSNDSKGYGFVRILTPEINMKTMFLSTRVTFTHSVQPTELIRKVKQFDSTSVLKLTRA